MLATRKTPVWVSHATRTCVERQCRSPTSSPRWRTTIWPERVDERVLPWTRRHDLSALGMSHADTHTPLHGPTGGVPSDKALSPTQGKRGHR
eukprot:scaffold12401_cov133-Isochrysis_galbana.AAC.2